MCAAGGAAAGGGAAVAAMVQAIKASGLVVELAPEQFERILDRIEEPLVVVAEGGFFSTKYRYLTSYKGLAFHTKTTAPLHLPRHAETVAAKQMWNP